MNEETQTTPEAPEEARAEEPKVEEAKAVLDDLSGTAQRLLEEADHDVAWVEKSDVGGRRALVVAPLSVAGTLATHLYEDRTVVATSATLTLGGRFDTVARALGLEVPSAQSPSPAAQAVAAVTEGPGLAGALLVGVNAAKAIAMAWNKPLIPVNHLEGHVYANWLVEPGADDVSEPAFPAVCLIVSGGHTELLLVHKHGVYEILGRTLDDAAGEAFDKGARILGLGFPGGPAIQNAAAKGRPVEHFPRAWLGDSYDFSFSGLKTAVARWVERADGQHLNNLPTRSAQPLQHSSGCRR